MRRPGIITLIFITAGLLFSGYMSAVKLFSGTCAFSEPCPYFLGYPACWYGFLMYLVMFVATVSALKGWTNVKTAIGVDGFVAALGMVFSGNFIVQEIMSSTVYGGPLALSTCVYGFVFYTAILITVLIAAKKYRSPAA